MKHVHCSLPLFVFIIVGLTLISASAVPTRAYATTLSPTTIKNMVEKYFNDAPDMVAVAQCESGFRQFDDDGNVLRGGYGDEMVGVYQIDETVHRDTALSMGYDIDSFLGNLLYARYLYSQDGVNPWIGCVGHAPDTTAVVTQTNAVTYSTDDAEERIRRASYDDMLKLLLEKRKQGLL